jgi:integrase
MSVCTRADGQIFVQWTEDGKRKRRYFGSDTAAMAAAVRFNEQQTRKAPVRHQSGPLFAELAGAYLEAKSASMSAVSMANLVYKLRGSIFPRLGDLEAAAITPARLDQYVNERAKTVKLTTVHRELCDVRAILNWSVKRGLLARSPMTGFDMPTRDDATVLPVSQAEIEAIIANSPEHLRRAMLLSFFCGLRPGAVELLSIRYSQVNWSAGSLTIISARKGGVTRREIPIHAGLPLRQWFETDGANPERHIITWQGKPVARISKAWATAKRAAGVGGRKIPPYAIRHAFVTTLLHHGVDLRTIADISGHDVRTMLKHYAHSMSSARQAAIDSLPTLHPLGAETSGESKKGTGKESE